MQEVSQWVHIATLIGALVALITLIKGVFEYTRQGAQKRADHFFELRKRYKENEKFMEIIALLDNEDPKVAEIPFKQRRDFLGFYEEIAIAVNSGLVRAPVAHYMFGYYAIKCWEDENFSGDVHKDSAYWALMSSFVDRMKAIEKGFEFNNRDYRF